MKKDWTIITWRPGGFSMHKLNQMKEERAIAARIVWRHWEVLGMHQGWKEKSERPSEGGKEATTSPTSTRQEVERCPIIGRRRGQAARRFHVDGFPSFLRLFQAGNLWVCEIKSPVPVVCSPWTSTDSTEALNHKCNDTCLFNKGKTCLMTVTLTNFWSVCDLVGLGGALLYMLLSKQVFYRDVSAHCQCQ